MPVVLVTGATGFIGFHLVRALLSRGSVVRALVLPGDPGQSGLTDAGAEIITGDIRDAAILQKAAAGCDTIFHLASVVTDWAPQRLFDEITVGGAENVCAAAIGQGVRRLVHISTNDVFGRDESAVMDETCPLRPWGEPYPDAKIAAEKIIRGYGRDKGLDFAMVYPCWVYGPGDRTFVPLLADAIVGKEMVFWRKHPLVWPTYVENLVDLLLVLSRDPRAAGQGYLVHDGESVTLEDFCARIAEALGCRPPTLHIPYAAAYGAAAVMEAVWRALGKRQRPLLTTYSVRNLGSRFRFSIAKAERELGWRPSISFDEGLTRTLVWLRDQDPRLFKTK